MAKLTAAQTTAELQRKASLGINPTSSANQAQYNQIKTNLPKTPAIATPSNSIKPPATPPQPKVETPKMATGSNIPVSWDGYGKGIGAGMEMQKQQQTPQFTTAGAATSGIPATYFDKNYGGMDKYASDQNKRYLAAVESGDAELVNRLIADSNRVGYKLNSPTSTQSDKLTETPGNPETPQFAPASGGGSNSYTPTYTGPNTAAMEESLKAIFANRQASELQKLREARQVAQQGLNKQETAAKQGAYDARNQADVVNVQGQQRMNETMANAGLTTDGQNLTLQAGQNAARLGALTGINQQENNAMQDISERRGLIDNNAAANELALTQQINSDQAGAQYDLMKYGDTRAFDVERYNYDRFSNDRSFDRSVLEDDRDFGYQAGQDQIQNDAQFGGTYNGSKTVGQTQQEWQNRFNYGNAIGQFGNGQQTLENKQFQEGVRQDNRNFDRAKYESDRNYQFQTQQAAIQNGQWQQQYSMDVEKFGFQQANEMWSQAFQENRAGQDDAYRKQTLDQEMTQADRSAANQATDAILKSGLVTKTTNSETGKESISVTDPDKLNSYIKLLNLSNNATDSLLYQFGLDSYVKK